MACHGLKRDSFHLLRHPKWSTIMLEKHMDPFLTHFFVP